MDKVNSLRMDDHTLLIGLISALGLKEIWNIWKKKIDIGAKKEERKDNAYAQQIEVLTNKIQQLETKIELLIEENIQLRIKVAKMSERLINTAKKRVQTRRKKDESSN